MERKVMKPVKFSFCHSSFVFNNIQNYKNKTLVLDTRDPDFYIKARFPESINIPQNRMQNFLQTTCNNAELSQVSVANLAKLFDAEEAAKFSDRKRRFCIVIMSETTITNEFIAEAKTLVGCEDRAESFEISETIFNDTLRALFERIQEEKSISIGLELYKILQKDRIQELHILVDGSSEFFEKYPFVDQTFANPIMGDFISPSKLFKAYEFPHDILDGKLFLGSCLQANQLDLLTKLKITNVINAAYECPNKHEDKGVKYLKFFIRDETEDCISAHFKEAYECIEQIFEEGSTKKVLVHCAMGKSRSAIIVIMYLMKKFSWCYKKAYEYVKSRRNLISPFHGFVKELEILEKHEFDFDKQSLEHNLEQTLEQPEGSMV